MGDALPVPYFHVVFTLPHQLNPMFTSTPECPSFDDLVKMLYSLKWVVYVEKPQGKVENVSYIF